MSEKSGRDDRVARGATLYSKKDKENKDKSERQPVDINNLQFPTENIKSIPDTEYEDRVISELGKAGIEVNQYKKRYLLRRIRVRLGRLRLNTYREYLDHIRKNPGEIAKLQESLSINVTRFFRNRDTFDELKQAILPELVRTVNKNNNRDIKMWSAGCAVGAEPYTLAIICEQVIPSNINVRILGTDIKDELLSTARYGIYSEPYLAEMSDYEITKYFDRTENGDFSLKSSIKKCVQFNNIDLMKLDFPQGLDLIVCRNVLIYVDRDAQNDIIAHFFKSLNPGGYLVLGRTETLFSDWRKHVNIVSTKHRIYQKKESAINVDVEDFKRPLFDKKTKKDTEKVIKAIEIKSNNRLDDLRNFKKTFEERKKLWEEKLEQQKKERESLSSLFKMKRERGHLNNLNDIKSTSIKNLNEKPLTVRNSNRFNNENKLINDEESDKPKIKGPLTLYRNNLKKVENPKISVIRKDLYQDIVREKNSSYRELLKKKRKNNS